MPLLDTHCHIDLFENPENLIHCIENKGIYTIALSNIPSVFFYTQKLCSNKKFIRPALGLHPELAYEKSCELDKFISLIHETDYIGEIGLDNSKKSKENYQVQKRTFEKILSVCAETKRKKLTIHSRMAESDVINMVGANFPGKIILHWYSGSLKNLNKALEYGYYFSINFSMTNSINGQKIINAIPMDRLLTESDGPFIHIGNKINSPELMNLTIERLANIKNLPTQTISQQIFENFKNFLK